MPTHAWQTFSASIELRMGDGCIRQWQLDNPLRVILHNISISNYYHTGCLFYCYSVGASRSYRPRRRRSMPTVRPRNDPSLYENGEAAAVGNGGTRPLPSRQHSPRRNRQTRSIGWYAVAIAGVIAVTVFAAINGHAVNLAAGPRPVQANVEQIVPFELMVKARDLPVQATTDPF
jgi:hypothetical protein